MLPAKGQRTRVLSGPESTILCRFDVGRTTTSLPSNRDEKLISRTGVAALSAGRDQLVFIVPSETETYHGHLIRYVFADREGHARYTVVYIPLTHNFHSPEFDGGQGGNRTPFPRQDNSTAVCDVLLWRDTAAIERSQDERLLHRCEAGPTHCPGDLEHPSR